MQEVEAFLRISIKTSPEIIYLKDIYHSKTEETTTITKIKVHGTQLTQM